MDYIVFKFNQNCATYIDGKTNAKAIDLSDTLKTSFKNELETVSDTLFTVNALSDTLYFAGFAENTSGAAVVQKLNQKYLDEEVTDIAAEDLASLLRCLPKANVWFSLNSPIPLHKNLVPATCVCKNDAAHSAKVIQTAYGDYLCEDCWTSYVHSDSGLVEYAISVGKSLTDINVIPANNLLKIRIKWREQRENLVTLTEDEKLAIEAKWLDLGFDISIS